MKNLLARSSCSALLITCSDFRFKSTERGLAESLGLVDDYDLIARPGAARSLVVPRTPAARDTLGDEIRLLWSVHQFPRVILLNHISCRAYDDLATTENEVDVHSQHLLRAVPIVEAMCAGLQAEAWLMEFDGDEFRARRVDQ